MICQALFCLVAKIKEMILGLTRFRFSVLFSQPFLPPLKEEQQTFANAESFSDYLGDLGHLGILWRQSLQTYPHLQRV